MDTLTSVDPTTAATAIGTTIQILILNNWSFVVAALVAVAAIKLFKAGVQLVLTIIVAGIALSVLTNMGLIPPINEILAQLGNIGE